MNRGRAAGAGPVWLWFSHGIESFCLSPNKTKKLVACTDDFGQLATNSLIDDGLDMPRKKSTSLTDAELRIMEILWARGSATVADVVEALAGKDGTAYTTILTLMRILRDKGYLSTRKEGRAHVYIPRVRREEAARNAVRQLLGKFFSDSPGQLVLTFLREEEISPEELDELKRRIQKG